MTVDRTFNERLSDTQRWLKEKTSISSLRSKEIEPEESLYAAFKNGTTADQSLRRQVAAVESVVLQRSRQLTESDEYDGEEGRLLAVELPASMYDGIASAVSDGFYDDSDAPPWDHWIKVVIVGETGYLLSWIPSTFFQRANAGVDANGGEYIRWVDVSEMTEERVREKLLV